MSILLLLFQVKCDAEFSSRLYDKVIGLLYQERPIPATPPSLNSFCLTERNNIFLLSFIITYLHLTPYSYTTKYKNIELYILFKFEDYAKGKISGSTTGVGIEVRDR